MMCILSVFLSLCGGVLHVEAVAEGEKLVAGDGCEWQRAGVA